MGLHARIQEDDHEVMISVTGSIRTPELDQLRAIVAHFKSRGDQVVLDLRQAAPVTPSAAMSLNRITENMEIVTAALDSRMSHERRHRDSSSRVTRLI